MAKRTALSILDSNEISKRVREAKTGSSRAGANPSQSKNGLKRANKAWSDDETDDDFDSTVDDCNNTSQGTVALRKELRLLGESPHVLSLWLHSVETIKDCPRPSAYTQLSKQANHVKTSRLQYTSVKWLQMAYDMHLDWSRSKGVSQDRLNSVMALHIPEMILSNATPLLSTLLRCVISGEEYKLTSNDIKAHIGAHSSLTLDGVYIRLGIGETDEDGLLCGKDICQHFNGNKDDITPSFFYVGETGNMFLRCLLHDIDGQRSKAFRYHLNGSVKAIVQLPLLTLPNSEASEDERMELRQLMEGTLIAALGAFQISKPYEKMRCTHGLQHFAIGMKGVNGSASTVRQHKAISFGTTQVNPTLQPRLQTVLSLLAAKTNYERLATEQKGAKAVALSERARVYDSKLQEAKADYLSEKGNLVRRGIFVCIAKHDSDPRTNCKTFYRVSNLFGFNIRGEEMKDMVQDGFAKWTSSNQDIATFRVQCVEFPASEEDYYYFAPPASYDYAKGLQLLAVAEKRRSALMAYKGGPRRHLAIRDREITSKSAALMRFLVSLMPTHQERTRRLEGFPSAWWRRKADEFLALRPNDIRLSAGDFGRLTPCHIALLDGDMRLTAAHDRSFNGRRVTLHLTENNKCWRLISVGESTFREQNPSFSGNKEAWVRVNLERENDNELYLKMGEDGIASQRLKITLDYWTNETSWQPLHLKSVNGGATLLKELVQLSNILSIGLKDEFESVEPEMDASEPHWVRLTRKLRINEDKDDGLPRYQVALANFSCYTETRGLGANGYHINAIPRNLGAKMGLSKGDSIEVFIDFWRHESKSNYRVLISRSEGPSQWYALHMPKGFRDDLERIRNALHL